MALMDSYGLPTGTNIAYGEAGFPAWVYRLADAFNLRAATYPGHQESERAEKGFAPNPQRLNRGIDWAGSVADMQRFADYLLTIRQHLEQVIWENPQTGKRVGVAGGDDVSNTGYYAPDYADHRDHVHTRQATPIPLPQGVSVPAPNRPDYNEYPMWSPNRQSRNGQKPVMALIHTQEGPGNADSLARFLCNPANQVSYHYTVSEDPNDHGVTVVDVVDTDYASWSVLDYNNRSINLCFAGSSVNWSRDQWLRNPKALEAAAYLLVQDAKKYGFAPVVVPPPYKGTPGISDHAYVTSRGIGTHSDCGRNFPWDVFTGYVTKWSGQKPDPITPVPPPPGPVYPKDWTDRQLMEQIWADLQTVKAKL